MPKHSVVKKNKKKITQNPDTAIRVAIIALIGTIITAIFSSPILSTWAKNTPTPILTLLPTPSINFTPIKTNEPISLSVEDPYSFSSNKVVTITPAGDIIEMVFYNPSSEPIYLDLETYEGVRFMQIVIPPGTSQIIYMPAGNYIYRFISNGNKTDIDIDSGPQFLPVTSKQELCFRNSLLEVCSPSLP